MPDSIGCPRCRRVSWNSNDIAQGYCGFCHEWHEFMPERNNMPEQNDDDLMARLRGMRPPEEAQLEEKSNPRRALPPEVASAVISELTTLGGISITVGPDGLVGTIVGPDGQPIVSSQREAQERSQGELSPGLERLVRRIAAVAAESLCQFFVGLAALNMAEAENDLHLAPPPGGTEDRARLLTLLAAYNLCANTRRDHPDHALRMFVMDELQLEAFYALSRVPANVEALHARFHDIEEWIDEHRTALEEKMAQFDMTEKEGSAE